MVDATGNIFSSISEGARLIPATLSDDAASVIVFYPNQLIEVYSFQKLKNGNYQAMYTQLKAEGLFPKASVFISDCSYLNLEVLQK